MSGGWSYPFLLFLLSANCFVAQGASPSSAATEVTDAPTDPTMASETSTDSTTTTTTMSTTTTTTAAVATTKASSNAGGVTVGGVGGANSGQQGQQTGNGGDGSSTEESAMEEEGVDWLSACFAVLVAMNIATLVMIRVGLERLTQAHDIIKEVTTSAHVFGKTSFDIGVGRTARGVIINHSKGNPEFAEFLG